MKYEEWKWSPELITNQSTVDYQHQTLFNIINDLIRACNDSDSPNGLLVEVALDELLKYATHHFRDEEDVMAKANYKDLANHKAQHQNFVNQMLNFKNQFDQDKDISLELITFMKKWLVDHIMTKDKEAMKACL